MPPSAIFHIFKKTRCQRLQVSTTLSIPRATLARLRREKKGLSRDFWFATTYPGEGKLKVAVSVSLRVTDKKGHCVITMYWFLTGQDPPADFLEFSTFESHLAGVFGEREVNVRAECLFDKNQIVSLFKSIDMGEQSQIFDEIVGFTGVKHDPEGKILYTMEIAITDASIEINPSFRQTVRLEDKMPIALLETASKISALAIKPKEIV